MRAELGLVVLSAHDVDSVVRFFRDALAMPLSSRELGDGLKPVFTLGQLELAVLRVGDPYLDTPGVSGIDHVRFDVPDVAEFAKANGLKVSASTPGRDEPHYLSLDMRSTCNVSIRLSNAPGEGLDAGNEPAGAGVVAAQQSPRARLYVATDAPPALEQVFIHKLGCKVLQRQTAVTVKQVTESFVSDKYGAVVHSRPPAIDGGVSTIHLDAGRCQLALLSKYEAVPAVPNRAGDRGNLGAQNRELVDKGTGGLSSGTTFLCLLVSNLEAELARLEAAGWRVSDQPTNAGDWAAPARFIDPAHFGGGLLLALCEA